MLEMRYCPKADKKEPVYLGVLTKRDILNLTVFLPLWMIFIGPIFLFFLYGYNCLFLGKFSVK